MQHNLTTSPWRSRTFWRILGAAIVALLFLGAGAWNAFALPVAPVAEQPVRDQVAVAAAPGAVDSLSSGLLAHWKFDEGSGSTVPDASGNNNGATLQGWPWPSGGWTTYHAPTVFANPEAIDFSGAYATAPHLDLNAKSFTIAAWADFFTGASNYGFIMGQGKSSTRQGLHFGFRDNNVFTCAFYGNDLDVNVELSTNGWHHWACTYDATSKQRRIYRDGVMVAADSADDYIYSETGGFFIGSNYRAELFYGQVDDARVYNRALSPEEVASLGNQDRRPVGYWKLDGNGNDSSGNSFTLDLDGSGAWSPTVAPTAFSNSRSWHVTEGVHSSFWVAHAPELLPHGELTAAAWVQLANATDDQKIVGKTNGSPSRGYVLGVRSGKLYAEVWDNSGTHYTVDAGSVPVGEWVHLAMSFRAGDVLTGYINGIAVSSTAVDGDGLGENSGETRIGRKPWGDGFYVTGSARLDDVRVYNRRLNAQEIAGLAGDGRPQAYWRLDFSTQNSSGRTSAPAMLLSNIINATFNATYRAPTVYENSYSLLLGNNAYAYAALSPSETAYAVSLWFKTSCTNCGIYSVTDTGGGAHDRHIYLNGGKVCARLYTPSNDAICTTEATWANNGWHHVVHTFGGSVGAQRLYVDGVLRVTGTGTASAFNWDTTVRLGVSADAATDYLTGYIDDVRVFDRGLSAKEVAALHSGERTACLAKPNDTREGTDGTIYATLDGTAVQAGLDLLGVQGGTVNLSGDCVGTVSRGGAAQIARFEPAYAEASLTLAGGWDTDFNASSTPALLDAWGQGRAVYAAGGAALTLDMLTLTNGKVTGDYGGAVYTAAPATISDSTVSSSSASNTGGGVFASANLTLSNVTVTGNTSTGGGGGGVFAAQGLTISSSTVSNNTAPAGSGGGIYVPGSLTMTDATVSGNSAFNSGGIYADTPTNGSMTLTRVAITGNTATNSVAGGLGIYKNMTMDSCTVSGNSAPEWGGGLYMNPGASAVTIRNSTFSHNTAASGGGLHNRGGTLNLYVSTVTDNQAPNGSGVYGSSSGATTIAGSIVAGNRTAATTNGADLGLESSATFASGGGNVIGGGNVTAFTADFDQVNVFDPGLGVLRNNGGSTQTHLPDADSLAVDSGLCTVGGETYTTDQRGSARAGSGSNFCDAGAVEVQSVTAVCFASRSTSADFKSVNARALQHAIDNLSGGTGTVRVGGTCTGVWYKGGTVQTVRLGDGITLIGGTAATYLQSTPTGRAVLNGSWLGRVLYAPNGTNTASNLELTNGLASGATGAGLRNEGTLTLNNGYVHDNNGANGAGISNNGTLTLNDTTVSSNDATATGGGIHNDTSGTLTLNRVSVSSNTAATSGGGLANSLNATLTDVTFTLNTATTDGGGLYNGSGATATLTSVTFSANTASLTGGALANEATATLTQVTMSGNTAGTQGGGIVNRGSASIRHSTITDNSAPKGAGIASNSTGFTKVGNSIVSGNDNGDDVERSGGTNDVLQSLGYNLVGSINTTAAFRSDFDQVWVMDPRLTALASNGGNTQTRALMTDSQALDTGGCTVDGNTPTLDQRGASYPRPGTGSSVCDIGAYERQNVTANCTATTGSTTLTSVNARAVQMAVDAAATGGTVSVSGTCQGAWRKTNQYQLVYTANPVVLTTYSSATLDAQGKGRVLTVGGGQTYVSGPKLTLANGLRGSGGGVNVLSGARAVITATTIATNTAAVSGGGIAAGGTLTITNSTVRENTNTAAALAWSVGGATQRYQDSGPFANHGTCYGSTCPVIATVASRTGLQFNGGEVVRVPDADSLNVKDVVTVAAWLYVPTPANNQKLFGKVESRDSKYYGYYLGINSGKLDTQIWDSAGTQVRVTGGTIPANTWTHIAVTWRTGGKMTGYVNGALVAQTASTTNPVGATANDFVLGAAPWSVGSYKLTGTIRQVRAFNKELSQSEITQLYNGTLNEAALAGGGQGGALYLASGSAATVEASTFNNNTAGRGGGIFQAGGTLAARNVTISGNTALWSGGGIWHAGGTAVFKFATVTKNNASANDGPQAANIHNSAAGAGADLALMAAIVSEPGPAGQGRTNCGNNLTALTSDGYNRTSDTSCSASFNRATDQNNKPVPLAALADNGGPTRTHKLSPDPVAVDIMDRTVCESQFDLGAGGGDQRGRERPRVGIRVQGEPLPEPAFWKCDAGAFELGIETHRVCGPPLLVSNANPLSPVWAIGAETLCDLTSITTALAESQPEDTIVVNGVVTETVTINKNVTIRGPSEEQTPAWHLGIVQPKNAAPTGAHNLSPIFTINSGITAVIKDLNLRYGDASYGGAVKNSGKLTVERVTLYNNNATEGAAIYSTGALTLTNSTVGENAANAGNGAVSVTAAGSLTARYNTFKSNTGLQLKAGGTAIATGNIFAGAPTQTGLLCQNITSGGYNLSYPDTATDCTTGATDISGDPVLGTTLRDNGGVTLTYLPGTGSAVLDNGGLMAVCRLSEDQRGIARPFDSLGGGGAACDIGAVEAGLRTLRVCANCETDRANLRFNDLQTALDQAGAGETVLVEAGEHTGNFVAYRDVTIRHAGFDMTKLHRDLPVDVRAILQASNRTVAQQRQFGEEGGTVLQVESYTPIANTILPSSDVTVILNDLTIRNGLAQLGGGIFNRGNLTIERATIAGNAARNAWNRSVSPPVVTAEAAGGGIYNIGTLTVRWSTISGNVSEAKGGALASGGTSTYQRAYLTNTTLAENKAARLPDTWLVGVNDAAFEPDTLNILSEDAISFENRTTGQPVTLYIAPSDGVSCEPRDSLTLAVVGAGPSKPLICKATASGKTVTITDGTTNPLRTMTITLKVPVMNLQGNTLFVDDKADVQLTRAIVSDGDPNSLNCKLLQGSTDATITSGGYSLLDDTSCLTGGNDLMPGVTGYSAFELGPLQDNNWIDFDRQFISGYSDTHALRPGNPGIDLVPLSECGDGEAATAITLDLAVAAPSYTLSAGDVVIWTNSVTSTVALNDGEANVMLLDVPAGATGSRPYQFAEPGVYSYRVYGANGAELSKHSITVLAETRLTDQRGMAIPQRGVTAYKCDAGALEYRPWVVSEALLRPPSAVGSAPPLWQIDSASVSGYDVWSGADSLDIAAQPTPLLNDGKLDPDEWAAVLWDTDPSPSGTTYLKQYGTVEWPDAPQVHIANAPVTLVHDKVTDGYAPTAARAFINRTPDDTAPPIVASNVFSRTLASSGATYSVIQFGRGTSADAQAMVEVVRTYDWTTPGVRDFRDRNAADGYTTTDCIIGSELSYLAYDGLSGHADPEGKSGKILWGTAFDGVQTTGDLANLQNTVDDLLPPAHVRENRTGPVLPVLDAAPTTGDDDLDVAWYRPDARQTAWPVKAVGYRCQWPANPPKIVVASELGSEIAGQPVLAAAGYVNPTIYSQPDPQWPGYSPNYEHALLSASNLGNAAPALYALRTDLKDRDTGSAKTASYALLKYQDAQQNNRIQMRAYSVVLTQTVATISGYTKTTGTVTPATAAAADAGLRQTALAQDALAAGSAPDAADATLTLKIGSGVLASNGTTTLALDAISASSLRSATVEVTYDKTKLTPIRCAPNANVLAERPYALTLVSDTNVKAQRIVHMRAAVAAGTDVRYKWFFGDEAVGATGQYEDREMSHVYSAAGTYTITVKASNVLYPNAGDELSVSKVITILPTTSGTAETSIAAETAPTGCRAGTTSGNTAKLVFDLRTLSKHGRSGDFKLVDLTFGRPAGANVTTATTVGWGTTTLLGPDYSELKFALTAGNPVYAPTPLRGLLDIQPCDATQASPSPTTGIMPEPFWKDWKGMLWTRAAGNMTVNYFYPLQPGFYLDASYITSHGLPADAAQRVGKCVPWLDALPAASYPGGAKPTPITYKAPDGSTQSASVYPTDYAATWPQTPGLLNVGETVYERAKGGVSAVASQVAVSRIYDDLAKGKWNNTTDKIELSGTEVPVYLTSLIDPIAAVKVELPLMGPDGVPALPESVETKRLLYGGGLSLLGKAGDPDAALPFSLRSRILYQDTPEDVDRDGETNGVLIFRGYYDGTSPEYIKGDPLLLLNVMAESDKTRLEALCDDGSSDCATYLTAVDDLYWKAQNPRALDLCRNATGELYAGDPDPTPSDNWGTRNNALSLNCPSGFYRDGQADHALLNELQDTFVLDITGPNNRPDGVPDNGDGIPEPFEGLGKGKALTAGNAAGTGYVTLAYNNDASLGALPVSLQVVKVECGKNDLNEESPYRGNLLVIKSDNLFDEKLTLRHTGDFGGRPDLFDFEWWIAAVDDTGVSPSLLPPSYPWQKWTQAEPGMTQLGPEITIEGANPTTLRDNWVIVRYKNTRCPVCGNMYRYSAFAGDPSAKPAEVKGQLAEGWIKRVINALNPFDTRVDDFVSSPVNTAVDMIRQAGPRYEGPVALNADPENLNSMGLIEAYQTILDRGRALSIDSGINDQGVNAALLNVTSRVSQLYMLLGNDAYMDALDPIVGFDSSTLGMRAPATFAFANQFRADQFGPIDEELALLRGRDETLGGVAAAPTYNRLTWNFTNGDGEVAYVLNYNIKDFNLDGFINEADAQTMYPQGHGDAYGQQLTALMLYYQLLRHQNYTWIPRAEPVSVAGAPVVVDYYDERRFAAAAAAKAKMGAEIVNLTYRKNYAEPQVQPYRDTFVDSSDKCNTTEAAGCNKRAWGVADWASRAGEGAYLDWLMANALVPPSDDRYTDVRKIDRTTVADIAAISTELNAIQAELDHADQGVNPLGLAGDAVLFDLDPALTKTTATAEGQTHFEQAYDKSISTMANSLKMFEFANAAKAAQREGQNEQHTFAADIIEQDWAIVNDLIGIFGYPYDKDIGVNGTYPEGYDGPDLYNFNLIERTDLTDAAARCNSDVLSTCRAETKTELIEFPRMECLGHYVEGLTASDAQEAEQICEEGPSEPTHLDITYEVGIGLDEGRGRYLPESWEGATRKGWGEIQDKLRGVYDARVAYEQAIEAYENQIEEIEENTAALEDYAATVDRRRGLKESERDTLDSLDAAILVTKETIRIVKAIAEGIDEESEDASECITKFYGLAVDAGAPIACTVDIAGSTAAMIVAKTAEASEGIADALELGKSIKERETEIDLFNEESDFELRQKGRELQGKIRTERELRLAMFLAADGWSRAQLDYDATVQKGYRKLAELIRMRKRWAGQVMSARYNDMAYRITENDALQKYRQQFDLAQTYTYLAAAAYDYETNLKGEDPAAGEKLLRQITAERSLGELRWTTGPWDVEPIVGSGGLAEVMGKLRDNFRVLKGQMGFNNPQTQTTRFSLRQELFRLRDTSDASWQDTLQRYYTSNIYANPDVENLAKKPYGMSGPQPGLVIPFESTIRQGLNFFGLPLGPGDGAYNPTQFATKIASVGVWFEGYDTTRLARMPYVYLLPVGADVLRPRNAEGQLRYWNVTEQLMPLPYPITETDMRNSRWIPGIDGLQGRMYQTKPYAAFQAFPYTEDFGADETNTDTRLIGRSVWNNAWVLVIPGTNLLADGELGIERFIEDVDDIYLYFQTYAYAGTMAASAGATKTPASAAASAEAVAAAPGKTGIVAYAVQPDETTVANPKPQPDAVFYGVVLRDGTPVTSGTLTAILPRLGTVSTAIAPITGTGYNYVLPVPLAHYDPTETSFAADSARLSETVRFTVDGVPALLKDPAGVSYQAYPIPWPGMSYLVTVDISGPGSYPLGDVNVSGKRDSADALLVLKYDAGLLIGVSTWPPGPNTVYLPLCDVTEDGACNSSDALRILMCDVGLASCPAGASAALATADTGDEPTTAPSAYFKLQQKADAAAGQISVRVLAESPYTPLGAAVVTLRYDPARLTPLACAENPAGRLDIAVCNIAYAPGSVRYTGITTGGLVESAALLEAQFQAVDPTVVDAAVQGAAVVALVPDSAFDLEGSLLKAVSGAPQTGEGAGRKTYLPLILSLAPNSQPAGGEPTPSPETANTPEPTPTESQPTPSATMPAPVEPEPTPSTTMPAPVEPEPTPSTTMPAPVEPEPTPSATMPA